jgi:uncharacterized protein (TIGR03437 family)
MRKLLPFAGFLLTAQIALLETRYPVSPGAYAQGYANLAGVTLTLASSVPLPTELGGVRVLVNNVAAPLVAVAPDAVSFVVPKDTPSGRVDVRVVRAAETLAAGVADVLPVSPGIFFVVGDTLAQGGVLNQSSEYAIQGSPAQRGQAIQIFATGQGSVDVDVADGAVPPAGTLARARGETKVYVSGFEAPVSFSGLSPQFPGLWQINATMPNNAFLSGRVALVVTIDGVPSNQVSFWVAP